MGMNKSTNKNIGENPMKYAITIFAIITSTGVQAGNNHMPSASTLAMAASLSSSRAQAAADSISSNRTQITNGDYSRMVPSVNAYAPAPTISCYKTGGASINVAGFGGGIGGGSIDGGCEMREYVRLGQADSDPGVRALASSVLRKRLQDYLENKPSETPINYLEQDQ